MVNIRLAAGAGLAVGAAAGFASDRQIARSDWRVEQRRSDRTDPVRPTPEYEYFGDYTYDADGRRQTRRTEPTHHGRIAGTVIPLAAGALGLLVGGLAAAHVAATPIDLVATRTAPVVALTGAALLCTGVVVGSVASWTVLG